MKPHRRISLKKVDVNVKCHLLQSFADCIWRFTVKSDDIVIVSAVRTPMGGFQGELAPVKAPDLGAAAIRAAIHRAGVAGEDINEVFMGCVLPAALGQAPARQASLAAGLPLSAGATTVNKVCGSGLKTVMFA